MDRETLEIYNKNATKYANLEIDKTSLRAYQDFSQALPKNGLVLDYGCGPGHFSKKLFADGFQVDAFDATTKYDGIWANFSLLHAPKKDFVPLIKTIFKALKPNGLFSIGLKLGSGERRDAIGRKYSYFKKQELEEILIQENFKHISNYLGEAEGLDGKSAEFIIILSHA